MCSKPRFLVIVRDLLNKKVIVNVNSIIMVNVSDDEDTVVITLKGGNILHIKYVEFAENFGEFLTREF